MVEGRPVGEIVGNALKNGLVVISAENNVLRLVPPLIIAEKDVDEMAEKLGSFPVKRMMYRPRPFPDRLVGKRSAVLWREL